MRLRHIVDTEFQVLFHSLSGFLSPFPRGTSSLSVAGLYLALSGGPDRFAQGFTCTVLLGILTDKTSSTYAAITLYGLDFHPILGLYFAFASVPLPSADKSAEFGLFWFRSPLLPESYHFLFLGLLRCFTSPGIAMQSYLLGLHSQGFPIRKSNFQRLIAAQVGLSQLTTSFIAIRHLGIHSVPFAA